MLKVLIYGAVVVHATWGLSRSDLYRFGTDAGDKQLDVADESTSPEVELETRFMFFGEKMTSVFVNTNGLLSFFTGMPNFFNAEFPLQYPVVAPFYADVDNTGIGSIWYRETSDPGTLHRCRQEIQTHFAGASGFNPKGAFVATWDGVGAFQSRTDKSNTFQVVLVSDQEASYVIFLYVDLNWIQGDGKTAGLSDALAQAGIMSPDGRWYILKGSGSDQVRNLKSWSNVGRPGVWMFRVGPLENGQQLVLPDKRKDAKGSTTQRTSCATGGAVCHSMAYCIDYTDGFCCECGENYIGNGINCVNKEIPLRVTGKFTGEINGIAIDDADLHSYVLFDESRTYTAVSRIFPDIGHDLQTLVGIGEGIAWLFASPAEGVRNGFMATGAVFNRTVDVVFPQTGHKVTIDQEFKGLDVFGNVALTTKASGSLPTVPIGSEIEIRPFSEEYTLVSQGQMRARSNRVFRLRGQNLDNPFTVDTTISFQGCEVRPLNPEHQTLRLKIDENIFIKYDEAENIVRYSFVARIGTLTEEDPCIRGREECGEHSQCVVEGSLFRCVCELGYDHMFDSLLSKALCVDLNECTTGRHRCHRNAICINGPGSYRCQCQPGFNGDGFHCQVQRTCADLGCSVDASCVRVGNDLECRCNQGFRGDGYLCTPERVVHTQRESCDISHNCSPYATCIPSHEGYECRCLEGFVGDGYTCDPGIVDEEDRWTGSFISSPDHGLPLGRPVEPLPYPESPYQDRLDGDQNGQANDIDQPFGQVPIPKVTWQSPDQVLPDCILDLCWCPRDYTHDPSKGVCVHNSNTTSPADGLPRPVCGNVKCECPEGYIYNLVGEKCDDLQQYGSALYEVIPLPECFEDVCICPFGYDYIPEELICRPSKPLKFDSTIQGGGVDVPCDVINTCHPDAQCVTVGGGVAKCQCNAGFEGDGYICTLTDLSCDTLNLCDPNAECVYDDAALRSVCICRRGYIGDGLYCSPEDECSSVSDCDFNAQCLYDSSSLRYRCHCSKGFEGDGFSCTSKQETGCNVVNNCHLDAKCIYDSIRQTYSCKCNPGYEGDGYHCQEVQAVGCNVLKNCGNNAHCVYSESERSYRCKCFPGFKGDGFFCRTSTPCIQDASVCHLNAICEPDAQAEYGHTCTCLSGFIGDGYTCQEVPHHEKDLLLLNQGLSVLRMPIDRILGEGFPVLVDPFMTAVGADIDCFAGRFYWTDVGGPSIRSSKYDGTERRPVVTGGNVGSPEDVAVDWLSRNVYWTDSANDIIVVASIDGTKQKTVIKDGLVNPRGITLHPGTGSLYWSDWNREGPKIETSALDGTGRHVLVSENLRLPNSIVMDYETQSLCWADAGTHRIECLSVNGFGRRTVTSDASYPFGLTLHHRSFFYTDWNDTQVHEVNKYNGLEEEPRYPPPGGSGKLYGIIAVPHRCPSVTNVCQTNYGNCPSSHLCLPNGRGGRTCACPDKVNGTDAPHCTDIRY